MVYLPSCLARLVALVSTLACRGHATTLRASHISFTPGSKGIITSNVTDLLGIAVHSFQQADPTDAEILRHAWIQEKVLNGVSTLAIGTALDSFAENTVWATVLQILVVLLIAVIVIGCVASAYIYVFKLALGRAILKGVETWDRTILGVDVNMRDLEIDLFGGSIEIEELTIDNPPGWNEKHLLYAGTVIIECSIWRFFRGHHIELDRVWFKNINVNFEKRLTTSNVHDFIDVISGKKDKPPSPKPSPVSSTNHDEIRKEIHEILGELILHNIDIEDIGVTVQPAIGRLTIPTFNYEDFDKKPGGRSIPQIIEHLLLDLCHKVLHQALHDSFGLG